MSNVFRGWSLGGLFANSKGPWGSGGGKSSGDGKKTGGKSPWGAGSSGGNDDNVVRPADFDFRKYVKGGGGGGGGAFGNLGQGPSKKAISWILFAMVLIFLATTSVHRLNANEQGVVLQFGRYSRTLPPGVATTLPWPMEQVIKVNVGETRTVDLGSRTTEDLMLTGDQSLIDLAYQVRWKIRDPEQYEFELSGPKETIRQVAESAMRAVIANVTLKGAMGPRRGYIEDRVAEEMQQTLDSYESGIQVLGVSLLEADPPGAVNDAFKEVTAAQQDAQTYINNANAYALQLKQKAQGEATAFDKVYEEYRLAPRVTKRRMYYETMEKILQPVDKTIVGAGGVNSYLPLPGVRGAEGASTARVAPQAQAEGGSR